MTFLDRSRQRLAAWPGAPMSALTGAVVYALLNSTAALLANAGVAVEAAGHLRSVVPLLPGAVAVLCVTALYGRPPSGLGAAARLGAVAGGIGVVVGYAAAGLLLAGGFLSDPMALAEERIATLPLDIQADARALITFAHSPVGRLVDAGLGLAASALGGVAVQWLMTRLRRRQVHVAAAA